MLRVSLDRCLYLSVTPFARFTASLGSANLFSLKGASDVK